MAEITDFPVIQPTDEEKTAYEQQFGPPPLNPIRDLSASELADLASADKENFEIVSAFRQNQDLWGNPEIVNKVADAHNQIKQRGFSLSDLPTVPRAASMVWDVAKGFGKQLWNYGTAAVTGGMGLAADIAGAGEIAEELGEEGTRRIAENIAGTEQALFGLSEMAARTAQKTGRALGISKPLTQFTPQEKVNDLWSAVGVGATQEDISRGAGGFLTPVGGEVIRELAEEGKPVRPEEVNTLAAGDPFSFYLFGKGFQAAGAAVPAPVRAGIRQAGQRIAAGAEQAAGATVRALGNLTDLGGRAAQITGRAAPIVASGAAVASGEPVTALAILGGSRPAARGLQTAGRKISAGGQSIVEAGRQVAGKPVVSPSAQVIKDVAFATPGAIGEVVSGTAADIGLAAVSSESPQQTESAVGIGTVFGAAAGARRVAGRVVSGQLIAPREYGVTTPVPSSGNFPAFDTLHSTAYSAAPPGVRARLNAVREFARGAGIDSDVFLASDAASLERVLTEAGVTPETAKQFSEQEGFFTTSLPDRSGTPRRVIVARNVEATPHESFHAFQDVLGESANQQLDALVRQEYAPVWENEGTRYANRLVGDLGNRSWEEVVLDASGWGIDAAKEKIYREVHNRLESETGAAPSPEVVRDLADPELVRIFNEAQSRNPGTSPEQFWREVLSPAESKAEADRYIARELAAENFDAVFKNRGTTLTSGTTIPERLARVIGNVVSTLGGEPLAGRRSEIGQIEPRFAVTEEVARLGREGATGAPPRAPASPPPVITPRGTPGPVAGPAEEARVLAESSPETPLVGGTKSPRELLGQIAEAIAQQAGIKINYLSAPGEPAAATTSNRTARRAIIEAFRTMPAAARSLWEKTFFPERVRKTKTGYQIQGWAPEVFASNAHKLAETLSGLPEGQKLIPYELDVANKTFTEAGWRQLFEDTQTFVRNQMAGQTGAGEPLVVPRDLTDRGFFAPQATPSRAVDLAQPQADTINMLFNLRLPETPRIESGKFPLNVAGQEVSIATAGGPQRLSVPVEPRAPFSGERAQALGIEGRSILEVNPVRSAIESAAKQAKLELPSFIEARQNLNLENIKEVELAPELPQFRGNTLTLTAGFQPSPLPRAIKSAATRDESTGRVFEGSWHGEAYDKAASEGVRDANMVEGFTTNSGEFLNREQALERATELKQVGNEIRQESFGKENILESQEFDALRQFQPVAETAQRLVDMTPEEWKATIGNYKGKLGGGLTGWAWDTGASAKSADDVLALRAANSQLSELAKTISISEPGGFDRKMEIVGRVQAAREAYEAATGQNLEGTGAGSALPAIRKFVDPDYAPPVKIQAQPERERTGLEFKQFFSDVTTGRFGKSGVPFEPVLDLDNPNDAAVIAEQQIHAGNFDEHIAKSIPTFEDVQIRKAGALVAAYPEDADVLDIGASEGSLMKTVSALSGGRIRTVSLDPNPDMAEFFRTKSQVPGAEFEEASFLRGFDDAGKKIPAYAPKNKFDVVNESMAFQFISPERDQQIDEAKRFLKPDGIFILEEKVKNPNWEANEKRKDTQFKNRYFSEADLKAKEKKVGFSQSKDESKAVGMVDNMVSDVALQDTLKARFAHVVQFWDSGNFKGYIASDSKPAIDRFVFQMGDVSSKFSTIETPRDIEGVSPEEMNVRLSIGGQFQPIAAKDYTETVKRMAKDSDSLGKVTSVIPNYTDAAVRMSQGITTQEWKDIPYAQQKIIRDILEYEFPDDDSFSRHIQYLGISPLEGFTAPPQKFTGVTGTPEQWKAVEKAIVENSDMGWFKGIGGNETLASARQKIVAGSITPDNYKELPRGEFDAAEAMFNLQKTAQATGGLENIRDFSEFYFTKNAESMSADMRAKLTARWGPGLGEFLDKGQFQPEEYTLRKPSGGFSKAWIAPSGQPIQLGGKWHHEWLNENAEQYGITTGVNADAESRIQALRKGFARINYGQNGGRLTIEARAADWSKLRSSVQQFIETNLDQIDNLRIELFNDDVTAVADSQSARFMNMASDQERLSSIPFMESAPTGSATEGQVTGIAQARSRQFQPAEDQPEFAGMPESTARPFLTTAQLGSMNRNDLMAHFPEAIVPRRLADSIPSDILNAPLVKGAENPTQTFGDKLAEFARSVEPTPEFQMGRKWYSEFAGQLKTKFGSDARVFAELLAATSPQTSVETNFKFALDALEGFKTGRFKAQIKKFEQGLSMIAGDSWKSWYNKELKAGRIANPPAEPTPAAFMARWIEAHDLKPRQSNGKLYGINSIPVLQVAARRWLEQNKGPKVKNFVENLLGEGTEATIDLWADRTLRRLGYAGFEERWRILPINKRSVSDADFEFAQSVFRNAAEQLGMKPSELQAAVWFAEKKHWADNGWVRLDLGDFRNELKKTDALRAEIRGRQQQQTSDLLFVEPRGKVSSVKSQAQPAKEYYVVMENPSRSVLFNFKDTIGPVSELQAEFLAKTFLKLSAGRGEYRNRQTIVTSKPERAFDADEWIKDQKSPSLREEWSDFNKR